MTNRVELTDAIGRLVEYAFPPKRIVSLCPSQTELLFDLGLGSRVVGATQWCVHPAKELADVVKVGGTKKVNLRKVASLAPDLILCEKEENTKEMVVALQQIAPVYVTNVESVADALHMIETVGALTGADSIAKALTGSIVSEFEAVRGLCRSQRTSYLIWKEPWMAAGQQTYINNVLEWIGLDNCMSLLPGRYPSFTLDQLVQLQPQLLLLSSEPYAFTQQHAAELAGLLPDTHIQVVDGEMFSWYGSRMLLAGRYLQTFCKSLGQTL